MKICSCSKPQYARVNGVFLGTIPPDAEKLRPFIGKYICFYCGGEAPSAPRDWDSVTGGAVFARLKEIGIIEENPGITSESVSPEGPQA